LRDLLNEFKSELTVVAKPAAKPAAKTAAKPATKSGAAKK
ncbi:MAG: hypothetical protein RL016_218, partial [Actinomycetota bacterium]